MSPTSGVLSRRDVDAARLAGAAEPAHKAGTPMDVQAWKQGDRVVVASDPEQVPGTIDGEVLVVSAGESQVRFWPVLFDDLSERMIEEKTLESAPPRGVRPRFHVGDVVKLPGSVAGTVKEVLVAEGQVRFRVEVWLTEAELERA